MKIPELPPPWADVLRDPATVGRVLSADLKTVAAAGTQKYPHWDKLRFLTPPAQLSHREWWAALKFQRALTAKRIPMVDLEGRPFCYSLPDHIPEALHHIDQRAGGSIEFPEEITNPNLRDRYVVSSLMEEAIRSSQLEGAATTRQIAREMIRTGRKPQDRSERMIRNNFEAMTCIRRLRDANLTPELVLELHRVLSRDTLDNPSATGRLRRPDEPVFVMDNYNQIFHAPPPAEKLEGRMAAMCDFANGRTPDYFIHPVVRAVVLHFWLAYDHPFVDGNGRCARALFYWVMLKSGYWLAEFISISEVIYRAPVKYYRAFLYTETDDNDLTYFVLYHLDVLERAIRELHAYVQRKSEQLRELERQLRVTVELNHRQRALLSHALRHPDARYTFESHQRSHGVVYETARTDLLDLKRRELLNATKRGRIWQFSPHPELGRRLSSLKT